MLVFGSRIITHKRPAVAHRVCRTQGRTRRLQGRHDLVRCECPSRRCENTGIFPSHASVRASGGSTRLAPARRITVLFRIDFRSISEVACGRGDLPGLLSFGPLRPSRIRWRAALAMSCAAHLSPPCGSPYRDIPGRPSRTGWPSKFAPRFRSNPARHDRAEHVLAGLGRHQHPHMSPWAVLSRGRLSVTVMSARSARALLEAWASCQCRSRVVWAASRVDGGRQYLPYIIRSGIRQLARSIQRQFSASGPVSVFRWMRQIWRVLGRAEARCSSLTNLSIGLYVLDAAQTIGRPCNVV